MEQKGSRFNPINAWRTIRSRIGTTPLSELDVPELPRNPIALEVEALQNELFDDPSIKSVFTCADGDWQVYMPTLAEECPGIDDRPYIYIAPTSGLIITISGGIILSKDNNSDNSTFKRPVVSEGVRLKIERQQKDSDPKNMDNRFTIMKEVLNYALMERRADQANQ